MEIVVAGHNRIRSVEVVRETFADSVAITDMSTMKLIELNARFDSDANGVERQYLMFDCPTCPHPETDPLRCECSIYIPVGNQNNAWQIDSHNLETLTVSPSIWHHCKTDPHFFIRNGEIQMC